MNHLLLVLLLLGSTLGQSFAQNITNQLTIGQSFFYYEVSPTSTGYQLNIYTLDNASGTHANSTLTYSSQIKTYYNASNTLQEVRVFVAQRQGFQWQIYYTDGIRLLCNGITPKYVSMGTMLPSITNNHDALLHKTSPTLPQAIQSLVNYFIENHTKHILSNNQSKSSTSQEEGTVNTPKGTYTYEIQGAWQETGQALIYIRHTQQGLVYQTTATFRQDHEKAEIKLLYAKRKGFTWEIYSSDYWSWTLHKNTQTADSHKESLFMPPIQATSAIRYKGTPDEFMATAIQTFIRQGEVLWSN